MDKFKTDSPFFTSLTESESDHLDTLITAQDGLIDYPLDNIKQFFWRALSVLKSSSVRYETVNLYPMLTFDSEIMLAFNPSDEEQQSGGFYSDIMRYIEIFYEELFESSLTLSIIGGSIVGFVQ